MDTPETNGIEKLYAAIETIQPGLEKRRRKFLLVFLGAVVLIVSGITVLAFMVTGSTQNTLPFVILASLLLTYITLIILNGMYRKSTKKKLFEDLSHGTGLDFLPEGVFPVSDLDVHKIIPPHDKEEIEDGFKGVYHGIPVSFQEMVFSDLERDPTPGPNNRKRYRELPVFQGLAVRITLPRGLDGHTVVASRSVFETYLRARFSAFQRVKLVSNKFEKLFDVLGTDQVEARVVLTPSFMEKFMETGKILRSRWMQASFRDHEIVLLYERRSPSFEIGILLLPLTAPRLKKTVQEIETIMQILDLLRKNPQFGLIQ